MEDPEFPLPFDMDDYRPNTPPLTTPAEQNTPQHIRESVNAEIRRDNLAKRDDDTRRRINKNIIHSFDYEGNWLNSTYEDVTAARNWLKANPERSSTIPIPPTSNSGRDSPSYNILTREFYNLPGFKQGFGGKKSKKSKKSKTSKKFKKSKTSKKFKKSKKSKTQRKTRKTK